MMMHVPGSGCTKKGKVGGWGQKTAQMKHIYAYFHWQAKIGYGPTPLAAKHCQSWLLFTRVLVNAALTKLHWQNLSAAALLALNLIQM
jgi:hypothetical protein